MSVKQISVSLDNTPGKFLAVSEYLRTEGINIRAISVADTSDMSTVRFVTDDPKKTIDVLNSHGYSTRDTDVVAVEVPDHPGGLLAILKPLMSAGINVHYLYTFLGRAESGQPIVILGTDKIEEALKALEQNWVRTFGPRYIPSKIVKSKYSVVPSGGAACHAPWTSDIRQFPLSADQAFSLNLAIWTITW